MNIIGFNIGAFIAIAGLSCLAYLYPDGWTPLFAMVLSATVIVMVIRNGIDENNKGQN